MSEVQLNQLSNAHFRCEKPLQRELRMLSKQHTLVKLAYLLHVLQLVCCSNNEHERTVKHSFVRLSDEKRRDIKVHGILLWASMGFLLPLGILAIRMCDKERHGGLRRKIFFYLHGLFQQTVSVILATTAAVLSIKNFENSFNNTHQQLGLALYGAIWLQTALGFRRPKRGVNGRSVWYLSHWLLGTTVSLLGIVNIYTGLYAYRYKTSGSTRLWTILFSCQVISMAFFYLFQDKWAYIHKQGMLAGDSSSGQVHVTPSPDQILPQHSNHVPNHLEMEPYRKKNALGNYFKSVV